MTESWRTMLGETERAKRAPRDGDSGVDMPGKPQTVRTMPAMLNKGLAQAELKPARVLFIQQGPGLSQISLF